MLSSIETSPFSPNLPEDITSADLLQWLPETTCMPHKRDSKLVRIFPDDLADFFVLCTGLADQTSL